MKAKRANVKAAPVSVALRADLDELVALFTAGPEYSKLVKFYWR